MYSPWYVGTATRSFIGWMWFYCVSFHSICLFMLRQRRRRKTLPSLPITWERLWPSMCPRACFSTCDTCTSVNVLSSLTERWRCRSQTWALKTVKSSYQRASCAYLTSAACWSSTTWFAAWGELWGDWTNRFDWVDSVSAVTLGFRGWRNADALWWQGVLHLSRKWQAVSNESS